MINHEELQRILDLTKYYSWCTSETKSVDYKIKHIIDRYLIIQEYNINGDNNNPVRDSNNLESAFYYFSGCFNE